MRIAERRNNLVTTADLERLGLSERTIRRLVASGQLHRLAPGVYVTSWLPDPVPQWSRLAELTERVGRPAMSELELELQQAPIDSGLPPSEQQHPVVLPSGRVAYLDLAYPECRLDIEIDHSTWHNTLSAIERDKCRDVSLAKRSWERLRFTERMLARLAVCVQDIRDVRELRLKRSLVA